MHDNVRALPMALRQRTHDSSLPRLPASHISRPRLIQRLLASDSRLSLICAPAGFGKSVLLNECARLASPAVRLVWLDLLGHPLSPAELLARLAAALQLPHGDGEPCAELSQLLGRVEQPLWIILDDYPRQPCAELDACLDRLLERAPHTLRWWINGRRRPAWNLPRLLLQGDLLELDAQALALDDEELERLLQQRQLSLPEELREQLLEHSEGWLAGVCLLLIEGTLQNLPQRLSAGTALLQEYVEREVLSGLPEALKRALLVLAHIPRFSAELCEHLLEDEDVVDLLATLRQRQLFLHGLDSCGTWFRLWRPLAAMLRRLSPVPLQAHVRACRWFAAHGDVRAAVEHALWAEQPEVAANFLQRYGHEQLLIGQSVMQYLHWRDELPASLFSSTPRLVSQQVWALITCARLDEASACLLDLARFLPQPDARRQQQWLAQYQAIQGVLQRHLGLRSAREHCLQALAVLAPAAWSQHVLCYQALAQQALAENDLGTAQQYCHLGLKLAREQGSVLFEALLSADRVHLLDLQGEHQRASELVEQSLQHLQAAGLQGPVLTRLLLLRGSLLASHGQVQAAEAALVAGLREAEACEDAYVLFGYQKLAELVAERGDLAQAQLLLRKAERQMQWQRVPEVRYRDVLQLAAGQLLLRQGEAEQARSSLLQVQQRFAEQDLLVPSGFYGLPLRVRHALALADFALGQQAAALDALSELVEDCQRLAQHSLVCEFRCSLAECRWLVGQVEAANAALGQAANEAERLQLRRPLRALYLRRPGWLEQALPQLGEASWQQVLHPDVKLDGTNGVEAGESQLSKREEVVLELIAQGCSNQQIAEQLYISLHTVKTHARRINVKLGVERRTQAVARAKALGWMD